MIAMKFTIELDIGLSFLAPAALPQLVTDPETKLIVVGGPSDRTAIADAALKIPQGEPSPGIPSRDATPHPVRRRESRKTRPLNCPLRAG